MSLSFPISATVKARGRVVDRLAPPGPVEFPIRYGLLVHPTEGPILIDTGYTEELWALRGYQAALYRRLLSPKPRPYQDPGMALWCKRLNPDLVRHVVLTHLHPDHACALARFPNATIHATRDTLSLWAVPPRFTDGLHGLLRGLLPDIASMKVSPIEDRSGANLPWGGTGFDILGDGSMVAVPLPGHMSGHMGVFFPQRDEPLLYAVDVAWTRAGYRDARMPPYPLRLALDDVTQAKASARTVLRAEEAGIRVVLCHDPEPLAPIR